MADIRQRLSVSYYRVLELSIYQNYEPIPHRDLNHQVVTAPTQRQTAVTAYLKSKQLLPFTFAVLQNAYCLPLHDRGLGTDIVRDYIPGQ